MKKQTAVEWLIKKLENRQNGIFDGLPHLSVDEIYNKAKAMEKEQMKESALRDVTRIPAFRKIFEEQFEKYYNETYGDDAQVQRESK